MTGVALATKLSARLRAVAYTAKSKSGFLPRGPMRYPPSASSSVEPPERRSQLNTRCPHPRRRSGLARSTRLISLIGFRLSQRGCSERSNSFIRQVDLARYDRPRRDSTQTSFDPFRLKSRERRPVVARLLVSSCPGATNARQLRIVAERLGALDLLSEALSTDKVSAVRMVPPSDPRRPSKTRLPITACWEPSFRLPHQQNRNVVRTAGLLCRFDQA